MLVLLTGGSGFLGRRIVPKLINEGHSVRVLARGPLPQLEAIGAQVVISDLRNWHGLKKAVSGCEAIIHTAGMAGVWGSPTEYLEVNYGGTLNLLDLAKEYKVRYFVYTSSPSVIYGGKDVRGVDETAPYAARLKDIYPYSKMLAEKKVLKSNSSNFKTIALRPHIIWGPGDPHFLPRLYKSARAGKLKLFTGGPYIFDGIYVENAADAHVHALKKLMDIRSNVDGQAFFIAQNEPIDINIFVNKLLQCASIPQVLPTMSPFWGLTLAHAIEFFWKILQKKSEPPLTVFTVLNLTTSHYYNLDKTSYLLDYTPGISLKEGLLKLEESLLSSPSS
ncbi:MAG: NAD-dependent epimerase/dehydratase family protein [Deltaproteobacteria bacterium]|jgi:nucleoside-diphosphate-sugar epimerase|nr:NAD-dependent epimerase/dehydratase family protein [Deltaproteobacteria bacterium]